MSRPLRARGLKHFDDVRIKWLITVAPLAGAWIETRKLAKIGSCVDVAPLAGAWIETPHLLLQTPPVTSRAPCGRVD